MRFNRVDSTEFHNSKRWNADFFIHAHDHVDVSSKYNQFSIGELVSERREFLIPGDYPESKLNYIGLENISQSTRLLVDFSARLGTEIKSRSKVFRSGDVLYGRLRPNLNKCLVVEDFLSDGICSTEIYVLTPDKQIIEAEYLAQLLVTERTSTRISALVSGAALPRIQLDDFFSIKVPVPTMDVQREIVNQLKVARFEFETHRYKTQVLPQRIANAFTNHAYEGGEFDVGEIEKYHRHRWATSLPAAENH